MKQSIALILFWVFRTRNNIINIKKKSKPKLKTDALFDYAQTADGTAVSVVLVRSFDNLNISASWGSSCEKTYYAEHRAYSNHLKSSCVFIQN